MSVRFAIMNPGFLRISFFLAVKAPFTYTKIYVYTIFFLIPSIGFSRVIGLIFHKNSPRGKIIPFSKITIHVHIGRGFGKLDTSTSH